MRRVNGKWYHLFPMATVKHERMCSRVVDRVSGIGPCPEHIRPWRHRKKYTISYFRINRCFVRFVSQLGSRRSMSLSPVSDRVVSRIDLYNYISSGAFYSSSVEKNSRVVRRCDTCSESDSTVPPGSGVIINVVMFVQAYCHSFALE